MALFWITSLAWNKRGIFSVPIVGGIGGFAWGYHRQQRKKTKALAARQAKAAEANGKTQQLTTGIPMRAPKEQIKPRWSNTPQSDTTIWDRTRSHIFRRHVTNLKRLLIQRTHIQEVGRHIWRLRAFYYSCNMTWVSYLWSGSKFGGLLQALRSLLLFIFSVSRVASLLRPHTVARCGIV